MQLRLVRTPLTHSTGLNGPVKIETHARILCGVLEQYSTGLNGPVRIETPCKRFHNTLRLIAPALTGR